MKIHRLHFSSLGKGGKSTARSLDQVKQVKDDLQNQFDFLDKDLQRKHKELRIQQDLIQQLRESLTELKNEKLKLSSDIQKKERLDEQLQKLTNSIQILKDEIENDKQSLEPLIVNLIFQKSLPLISHLDGHRNKNQRKNSINHRQRKKTIRIN
jgi:chromosome segregation ATPase